MARGSQNQKKLTEEEKLVQEEADKADKLEKEIDGYLSEHDEGFGCMWFELREQYPEKVITEVIRRYKEDANPPWKKVEKRSDNGLHCLYFTNNIFDH